LTRPAEEPGTPLEPSGNCRPREMVTHDRIRLTGLLRKKPWKQGFFYFYDTGDTPGSSSGLPDGSLRRFPWNRSGSGTRPFASRLCRLRSVPHRARRLTARPTRPTVRSSTCRTACELRRVAARPDITPACPSPPCLSTMRRLRFCAGSPTARLPGDGRLYAPDFRLGIANALTRSNLRQRRDLARRADRPGARAAAPARPGAERGRGPCRECASRAHPPSIAGERDRARAEPAADADEHRLLRSEPRRRDSLYRSATQIGRNTTSIDVPLPGEERNERTPSIDAARDRMFFRP